MYIQSVITSLSIEGRKEPKSMIQAIIKDDTKRIKVHAVRHEILARLFEQSYKEIADTLSKFP